jgi:hypothetical protein
VLTYLASLYLKEEELKVSAEHQIRNVLVFQLSRTLEQFRESEYPFVSEDGDFTYVVNLATFSSHDHLGSRKWRKLKVLVYDPVRAALLMVHETNIPLTPLTHESLDASVSDVSRDQSVLDRGHGHASHRRGCSLSA